MLRQLAFTVSFLMMSFSILAQTGMIKGTVSAKNGETIVGATITDVSTGKYLGQTNVDGTYNIELEAGTDRKIRFTAMNFEEKIFKVDILEGQEKVLNVRLIIRSIGVVQVQGIDERKGAIKKIPVKIVSEVPSISQGIEQVLIIAPVNISNELSSAYSVRGGSFDENLVYVNDIQVYRPFLVRSGQQEGLSFPNPDMVDNIVFSAGGFEAKYGDKMSSVLDIKYRNPDSFEGRITGSLLGGSVQVGDRIIFNQSDEKKEEGYISYNIGARYKSNSRILGTLDTQGEYNPNFFDLQSLITWKPKKYGVAEFSFLGNISRNQYNFEPASRQTDVGTINEALRFTVLFEGEEQSQFETFFGAFSAKFLTSESTFLRFTASAFQTYESESFDILGQYRLDELERDFGSDDFGEVLRNRGVGAFREHARNNLDANVFNIAHSGTKEVNKDNFLEWGGKFQLENINDRLSEWKMIDSAGYASPRPNDVVGFIDIADRPFQEIQVTDLIKSKNVLSSQRANLYLQNRRSWENDKDAEFTLNVGLRGTYWSYNQEFVGGPRAQFSYAPDWTFERDSLTYNRDIVFTLSGGVYYQPGFYKELRGINGELNPEIEAQQALHVVAGVDYLFKIWGRDFNLRSEIYYKDLNNLIPYEVENVRTRYYATNNSNGYATGLDLMLNGEFINGVESWMRASLLRTQENLTDDSYIQYINTDGDLIEPGFTLNQEIADSTTVYPGFIPRPTDQTFSFSMIFRDQMKKWEQYKVLVSMFYATGLPYGPPTFERYLDVLRLPAYRRVDIGFSRDFFHKREKEDPFIKSGWLSLEVFNILDINNTNNYTWVEDINGRQYGIANFLTGRRLNLKLHFEF